MASRAARGGGGERGAREKGSKRVRVDESSSRIPSIPGFEDIVFATRSQRSRFEQLQGMTMNPTRFLCRNSMIKLGLDDTMRNLFEGTGLRMLYGMQERSYRSLTLEFLSSLCMNDDTHELSFRIQNESYLMSIGDFGDHFGFRRSLIAKAPEEFSGHALWDCMSNIPIRKFTNVRINNIQHPAIRIWFRTVIGTIFGRGEVGTLNFTELSILGSFLNVQRGNRFALDLPYLVAKHMLDVAEGRIKHIEIGGIITFLVKSMGFDCEQLEPVDASDRWIDCGYLRASHHWLRIQNCEYRWRVTPEPNARYLTLPSNLLPALYTLRAEEGQGYPSYLIPEDMGQQLMVISREPQQRERRPRRAREEGSSSNPPPSDHEIYMNHWNFTNQRFAHHALNQNLTSYWHYHEDVTSGVARGPHPSYYRGEDIRGVFEEAGIDQDAFGRDYHRSYGGFGGQFLDEFGRLNLGGNTNDGGNPHDDDSDD